MWALLVSSSVLGYYAQHLTDDLPAFDLERAGEQASLGTPSDSPESNPKASITDDSYRLSDGEDNVAIPLCELHAPNGDAAGVGSISPDTAPGKPASTTTIECPRPRRIQARTIARAANWLRWIGKLLAIINAISIVANSIFQYAGLYTNCYCDSSVYSWGVSAFNVINPTASDVDLTKKAWIGGLALALTCCSFFVGSIYLIRDSLPS